jgi:hypothetical protein
MKVLYSMVIASSAISPPRWTTYVVGIRTMAVQPIINTVSLDLGIGELGMYRLCCAPYRVQYHSGTLYMEEPPGPFVTKKSSPGEKFNMGPPAAPVWESGTLYF